MAIDVMLDKPRQILVDFFGDELETLRTFDPVTQLSTGTVPEHLLLPASEALREIIIQEQEHLTDLADALGIDNPTIE